jgi:hypothetical protein
MVRAHTVSGREFATATFRTELELCLGWESSPVTLRQLADAVGATVSRVRYHVTAMAGAGRLVVSRDAAGRVIVSLPPHPASYGLVRRILDGAVICPASPRLISRSHAAAARELLPRSGAPEPGLGVIVVGGHRCWIEPPFALAG